MKKKTPSYGRCVSCTSAVKKSGSLSCHAKPPIYRESAFAVWPRVRATDVCRYYLDKDYDGDVTRQVRKGTL